MAAAIGLYYYYIKLEVNTYYMLILILSRSDSFILCSDLVLGRKLKLHGKAMTLTNFEIALRAKGAAKLTIKDFQDMLRDGESADPEVLKGTKSGPRPALINRIRRYLQGHKVVKVAEEEAKLGGSASRKRLRPGDDAQEEDSEDGDEEGEGAGEDGARPRNKSPAAPENDEDDMRKLYNTMVACGLIGTPTPERVVVIDSDGEVRLGGL